jgi:hypothetical protein
MSARLDIPDDDLFEIPAMDAGVIEENIVAPGSQILIDCQCSVDIIATVAYENCFLTLCHM